MLSKRSKQIRRDTIALSKAHGGYHYGGSFSCIEILIALFDHVMGPDDRFILSKGHACWPYYVLLRERGFNPKLRGHPERDPHNGIHCTTGSLGHGLPNGIGMALASKLTGKPGSVFVLMGDGECQTGTTWESLLIARQHKLDNLVAIVDWNWIQGSDYCDRVLPLTPQVLEATAFKIGWCVTEVDGHDVSAIVKALELRPMYPHLIVALTVKGKGISFMEGQPAWHSKWLSVELERQALVELE